MSKKKKLKKHQELYITQARFINQVLKKDHKKSSKGKEDTLRNLVSCYQCGSVDVLTHMISNKDDKILDPIDYDLQMKATLDNSDVALSTNVEYYQDKKESRKKYENAVFLTMTFSKDRFQKIFSWIDEGFTGAFLRKSNLSDIYKSAKEELKMYQKGSSKSSSLYFYVKNLRFLSKKKKKLMTTIPNIKYLGISFKKYPGEDGGKYYESCAHDLISLLLFYKQPIQNGVVFVDCSELKKDTHMQRFMDVFMKMIEKNGYLKSLKYVFVGTDMYHMNMYKMEAVEGEPEVC